jgi:molybdenum cofactor synthesis domain-containing protein
MTTAAAVIIGNEILTGKFPDENGPWLIARCRKLGVDLQRVAIIADEPETIAAEVRQSAASADYVFTTGGIGPTHDDVTMEGVAAAFGRDLVSSPEIEALIRARTNGNVTPDVLRMAVIPSGCVLWQSNPNRFPVVVCENVLIFPGVPRYFQAKFNDIAHRLGGVPMASRQLRTLAHESTIAAPLREAARRWPDVSVGSYPRFEDDPVSVIVALDSRDLEALDACLSWLMGELPQAP